MKAKSFLYIVVFYVIAIALKYYAVFEHPELTLRSNNVYRSLYLGSGPLVGGLIMLFVFRRKNNLSNLKIELSASLVISLLLIFLLTGFSFFNTGAISLEISTYVIIAIIYSAFEEYGWRGYLQTELSSLNRIVKYIVVSIFWFFWHLEFDMTFANYLVILGGSFGLGFVADKSKSLGLVAIFHSLINIAFTNDMESVSSSQKIIITLITAFIIILYMRFGKKIKRYYKDPN